MHPEGTPELCLQHPTPRERSDKAQAQVCLGASTCPVHLSLGLHSQANKGRQTLQKEKQILGEQEPTEWPGHCDRSSGQVWGRFWVADTPGRAEDGH